VSETKSERRGDKEMFINVEALLGRRASRSNFMGTGIRSSLGSIAEFKSIDLSKSGGEAMKRDRHRRRRGWPGIASESLFP
jgi:hypothetical protein